MDFRKVLADWQNAYAAFKGAFDTPVERRRYLNEYTEDARRRLREFNEAVIAAVAVLPAPTTGKDNFYSRSNIDDVWLCHDEQATTAMIEIDGHQLQCSWTQLKILHELIERANGAILVKQAIYRPSRD